jgi:hypothetical protein
MIKTTYFHQTIKSNEYFIHLKYISLKPHFSTTQI